MPFLKLSSIYEEAWEVLEGLDEKDAWIHHNKVERKRGNDEKRKEQIPSASSRMKMVRTMRMKCGSWRCHTQSVHDKYLSVETQPRKIHYKSIVGAYRHEKGCGQLQAILTKEVGPIQWIKKDKWRTDAAVAAADNRRTQEWFEWRVQGDKWLTGAEVHNRHNVDTFVISVETILENKVLLAGSPLAVKKGEMSKGRLGHCNRRPSYLQYVQL